MLYPSIPSQLKGEFHDIVSMICADSIEIAVEEFKKIQMRLVAVNAWHSLSEDVKSKFSLIDAKTHASTNKLEIHNFIRIDIPGPGNPSGNGRDWTQITDIQNVTTQQDNPFLAITIRPCAAPESNNGEVAHFYTSESTNTFIVRRVGTCIFAEVHGRNQVENTTDVPVLDSLRNKAITVGANLGLGGLNWLAFTKALLEPSGT